MSSRGSHFFVTERIAGEFARTGCALPPQFIVYENNDAYIRAEFAYKDVMTKFDVRTPEFGVDVRWLLECGHCLHSCEDIPLVKLLTPGSAFALTLNAKLVHRFLRSKDYRPQFESIVDDQGLEHLADLRLLHSNGKYEDLYAF